MQTCNQCHQQSPDAAEKCVVCGANLREHSTVAVAIKAMQQNPRVNYIQLSVSADACPVCLQAQGTYAKDELPALPVEGCSHELGCRCFVAPVLGALYP